MQSEERKGDGNWVEQDMLVESGCVWDGVGKQWGY